MDDLANVSTFDELSSRLTQDDTVLASLNVPANEQLVWLEYLKNPTVRSILSGTFANYRTKASPDTEEQLFGGVELHSDDYRVLLISAISALQLYVVDNFLCFITSSDKLEAFDDCLRFVDGLLSEQEYSLNFDGEKVHSVARHSSLLKLARFLFTKLLAASKSELEGHLEQFHLLVWSLRAAVVHQISLKSITSSLYDEIVQYTEAIVPFIDETSIETSKYIKSVPNAFKLNILNEIVSAIFIFGETEHSKKYFEMAQELSHLKFNLTGCLGKRTMYQEKAVSQLMVHVEKGASTVRDFISEESVNCRKVNLPKNEKLEDDTLLQDVKFLSSQSGESLSEDTVHLSEAEQCFLLADIRFIHRFGSSSDTLLREEVLAYIYFLLERSSLWSVSFTLLELRSLFERDRRRRVERSMKQIETLAQSVRGVYEKSLLISEAAGRIHYFYAVLPSPFWSVEKHLGDLLVSLGVFKSALDVYLRLEAWNEVIACYRGLGRPDKAEEIVRRKMEEGDGQQADLHCLLGEITGDIEHYHRSWEISGQRYARAPKMLGLHYFALKEFDQALTFLQASVGVNSMQMDAWYRIGYIALLQENWEMAANAYRRVLAFDEDSFEAWNNLSKAYIKLGDKPRAVRTLQEAIKCNFNEWKLWDNYIAVAADVGAFNEVLEAWNRLIELKGAYVDDTISGILVEAIRSNVKDSEGEPAAKYLAKTLKLFGRVTATSDGSAAFWRHYAQLMVHNREGESSRITQCLQKCHRKMLAISGWERDLRKAEDMARHCGQLADEYLAVADLDSANQSTVLNGGKLSLNSALVLLTRAKADLELVPANGEQMGKLEALLRTVEEKLDSIKQRLAAN